jgi:divinyl protochlorophyllide a 8-vinyl-reductase
MQVAVETTPRRSRRGGASASPDVERVGPNTLIQTLAAFAERFGSAEADELRVRARLPDPLPEDMVDERAFARLVRVLVREIGPEEADRVLADGGVGTGLYVLRHRIPRLVRLLLPKVPKRLALRVLLRAVRAHAWTFAGSADFEVQHRPGGAELTLAPSLVCVTAAVGRPMGSYYARAFEVLIRALVSPSARVVEEACIATGADACRFRVMLDPPRAPAPSESSAEAPCASS